MSFFSFKHRKRVAHKMPLLRKLMAGYLIMAVIPVILITGIMSALYSSQIKSKSNSLVDQNALQNEIIIQERMESLKTVLYNLITDSEFIHLTEEMNADSSEDSVVKAHLETMLESFVYTHDNIRAAVFVADNANYAAYSKWYSDMNTMIWQDENKRNALNHAVSNERELTFLTMHNLREGYSGSVDYAILMGLPVRNLHTKERSGVLIFAIDDGVLMFKNTADLGYGIRTLVVDDMNRIMAGAPDQYINQDLSEYMEAEYDRSNVSLRVHNIDQTQWTIVNIIDNQLVQHEIIRVVGAVVLVISVITCLFYLIVWTMCRKYTDEVQLVARTIEDYNAENHVSKDVVFPGDNELNLILNGFWHMSERNHSLIRALQQKNEEIRRSETQRRKAEIKALEAQINPHFLFNTLESINWKAIDDGEEEISNSLGMLGSLLRYSVSNIDIIVLLRAEIEWLKKYVYLQRERFGNSFDCEYEVTEEAMDFPVYKMLLQPLIENAILHAFEEIKGGGLIRVKAYVRREDGDLQLSVSDNGKGMDKKTLEQMRLEIKDAEIDSRSIGISNVANRLRIYYHGDASMEIESDEGKGTTVTMKIPYRTEV